MEDVNKMNLFNKEDNVELSTVEQAYHEEMMGLEDDSRAATWALQEKYENYFSSIGTKLITANPKDEDIIAMEQKKQQAKLSKRVQITNELKELIATDFDKLVHEGLAKEDSVTPICIECGKNIKGLGLICENDNSMICWDCVDSQNYIDYSTINICKFGGD